MQINHLHLHVRDIGQSVDFYKRLFGLRRYADHDGILFLRDEAGMDFALAPSAEPEAMPAWFHFGFRLGTPEDVEALYAKCVTWNIPVTTGLEREGNNFIFFRCQDPDGYSIEVYWED